MSLIYKIDKPKNKFTVADLIVRLATYDLDADLVWVNGNLYACTENKNHPYYKPNLYDLEYECKRIDLYSRGANK